MSLLTIVRAAVATAKGVTSSLQATVVHKPYTGTTDGYGTPTYGTPVSRPAIVDQKVQERRLKDGRIVLTQAYIAFLEPITPNGTAGRIEPIDPRDIITLPDGTTGPIIDIAGFIDAETTHPILSEVWLGAGASTI